MGEASESESEKNTIMNGWLFDFTFWPFVFIFLYKSYLK